MPLLTSLVTAHAIYLHFCALPKCFGPHPMFVVFKDLATSVCYVFWCYLLRQYNVSKDMCMIFMIMVWFPHVGLFFSNFAYIVLRRGTQITVHRPRACCVSRSRVAAMAALLLSLAVACFLALVLACSHTVAHEHFELTGVCL